MKKVLLFIASVALFYSCDRVKNPIPFDSANYDITLFPGNFATQYNYPSFGTNNNTNVNVLIEDYTGHQCGNCPQAAVVGKNIETANPGRVFVISEHAGTGGISQYQRWHTADEPEYPKYSRDFTNDAGISYSTTLSGLPGNPYGLINRRPLSGSNTLWIPYGQWQQYVTDYLQENNLKANLQGVMNYYDETDAMFVHIEAEAKTELTGNYNLVVYAIAKEVIDWQKKYTVFPNDVEFYEHHNVHIGNVNGAWGEPVFADNTAPGFKMRKDYTFKIPESFRDLPGGYAVVAYITNADTYEILQVIMLD